MSKFWNNFFSLAISPSLSARWRSITSSIIIYVGTARRAWVPSPSGTILVLSVWIYSGCCGYFQQSENMQVRRTRDTKLFVVVNMFIIPVINVNVNFIFHSTEQTATHTHTLRCVRSTVSKSYPDERRSESRSGRGCGNRRHTESVQTRWVFIDILEVLNTVH